LQCLFRLLLLRGLVAAQFFKFNAAVAVDLAAFKPVGLDFLDHKGRETFRKLAASCVKWCARRFPAN
jgi:hypothetical protein